MKEHDYIGVDISPAVNLAEIRFQEMGYPGDFIQMSIMELPIPDAKASLEIFNIHTRGKPLAGDVDIKALADNTDSLVGADIEAICRRASMLAIREFLGKHKSYRSKSQKADFSGAKISNMHFEKVIGDLQKQQ